jgi:hypothetical protein
MKSLQYFVKEFVTFSCDEQKHLFPNSFTSEFQISKARTEEKNKGNILEEAHAFFDVVFLKIPCALSN